MKLDALNKVRSLEKRTIPLNAKRVRKRLIESTLRLLPTISTSRTSIGVFSKLEAVNIIVYPKK
jgi:hypothetical protein